MNHQNTQPTDEIAMIVGDQMMTQEQYEMHERSEMERLHGLFTKMRDQWVQHRATSGVERRWRKATELYYGEQEGSTATEFESTLKNGPPARKATDGNRSRVVVNIVRPKVDQAVARMCEILFPVDDRNWGIKPTPMPEVEGMTGDKRQTVDPRTGQPTGLTADDEAKAIIEAAKEAAEKMQRVIDDNLTECKYNGEARKMIEDGVRLGTGIMLGPFPAHQTSKSWIPQPDGTQLLAIKDAIVPASRRVDPWDVYFDPACGNDHQRGRGFFYKTRVTRKEVRQLVGLPGYDEEALRSVLREQPKCVRVAESRVTREPIQEDAYEMWTYHGEIEPDEMERLSSRTGDPLTDVTFGVLIIINDKVVGAMQSWVVDGTLPVDVWTWRHADDSPYGFSLPDELEHQQRVVNASWRSVMDNGRTSLGGQIVMKRGMIIPQNGSYEITPNKVWLAKDELEDVRQAFSVFEFNSHLQELMTIATTAMQFADQEASMPQLLGGDSGGAPQTVGGMVMLQNNAMSVLRYRVKKFDDQITRPHIGRYYDWHMANNPDTSIKGDAEVDARGSSALVERDIQNQALLNLANITNNPRYVPHLREREELKAILRAFKVDPEDLLKPEDQVAQEQAAMAEQGAPQDPRVQAAQIQAQTKQMELESRNQMAQSELQVRQLEVQAKRENTAYQVERERAESEQLMVERQMERDLTIAKMEQDGQMTREELARKERLELIKLDSDRQVFNAEMAMKARTGSGI